MDGWEATRQIRKRENGGRRVPIIAATASMTLEHREKCLEAGMDDFVEKPLRRNTLARVLSKWLGHADKNPAEDAVYCQAP
jgi:CheY-like chemotaxis protein